MSLECTHFILTRCTPQALEHMVTFKSGDVEQLSAMCFVHNQICSLISPTPPTFAGARGHVAGVNCYDWSSMGRKQGWLGDGALPFLQWVRERRMCNEDWIIVENVIGFYHAMLEQVLDSYELMLLVFPPPCLECQCCVRGST